MTWREIVRVGVSKMVPSSNSTEDDSEGVRGANESDDETAFDELTLAHSATARTESLERTLDRAESVLEGQLGDLADTDDKAVRTVRIEILLLGVVASVFQITSKPILLNVWLKASGLLVIGSIVAGVFTYSSSAPNHGPGPDYVESNFASGDTNEDVYLKLLQGYCEAISHNSGVLNDSAKYLFVTQLLLVGGIVTGGIGILFVF